MNTVRHCTQKFTERPANHPNPSPSAWEKRGENQPLNQPPEPAAWPVDCEGEYFYLFCRHSTHVWVKSYIQEPYT